MAGTLRADSGPILITSEKPVQVGRPLGSTPTATGLHDCHCARARFSSVKPSARTNNSFGPLAPPPGVLRDSRRHSGGRGRVHAIVGRRLGPPGGTQSHTAHKVTTAATDAGSAECRPVFTVDSRVCSLSNSLTAVSSEAATAGGRLRRQSALGRQPAGAPGCDAALRYRYGHAHGGRGPALSLHPPWP